MSEASWLIPMSVVAGGLVGGYAMLALTKRKKSPRVAAGAARTTELRAQKTRLLDELRALGPDDPTRVKVELDAAKVMRELASLEGTSAPPPMESVAAASIPASPLAEPAVAPEPNQPVSHGISPQLVGALKGGALVGVAFILYLALRDGSGPRGEGMGMTGGTIAGQPAMAPDERDDEQSAEQPGAMAERAAPSLAPIPSPRLDAAREVVAAHPDSRDAKIALGWALVESKGWIEVFRLVETLVQAQPDDPEALALAAPVQLAMGQRQQATELLDKVLATKPEHTQALVWRGRIAQLSGDTEGQSDYWRRARASGDSAAVDATIAGFENAPAPKPHANGMGAPPNAPAPSNLAAANAASAIAGTITIASDVTAPPGATLFLIARTAGVTTGPPLATRKIINPTFPRAFSIGPEDMMLQGMVFGGDITIEARLDVDGDARTHGPDDLRAALPDPVQTGTRGLELELERQ